MVAGLAGCLLLCVGLAPLVVNTGPDNTSTRAVRPGKSPFDGPRAYRYLEAIVAMGPRVSDTPQAATMRAFIRKAFEAEGIAVREHVFEAKTPLGRKTMTNLVGVVQGTREGIVILGNHYDTKYFADFEFVGANDGGSTTAWMIEMGRALGPKREGLSVWLTFFDGEEAFVEWSEADSLYGSRAFVEHLRDEGVLPKVRAMINVDMIGDCALGIHPDPDAPSWLIGPVWSTAKDLGYGEHFLKTPLRVEDDHVPFRKAGIPALELIDFAYGGSFLDHRMNWHTPRDTLERVCPGSLQVVGDVIYHALPKLEAHLD